LPILYSPTSLFNYILKLTADIGETIHEPGTVYAANIRTHDVKCTADRFGS